MIKCPYLTVDAIILRSSGIVLIERKNPPYGLALPGGFVEIGETVEQAVVREVKEETGLTFQAYKQMGVYSNPKRDTRFHTVSVVFFGFSKKDDKLKAGDDAKHARIISFSQLMQHKYAFDHKEIIKDWLKHPFKLM